MATSAAKTCGLYRILIRTQKTEFHNKKGLLCHVKPKNNRTAIGEGEGNLWKKTKKGRFSPPKKKQPFSLLVSFVVQVHQPDFSHLLQPSPSVFQAFFIV